MVPQLSSFLYFVCKGCFIFNSNSNFVDYEAFFINSSLLQNSKISVFKEL